MRPRRFYALGLLAMCVALLACDSGGRSPEEAPEQTEQAATKPATPEERAAQAEAERQARLDKEFPLHGLVTGLQLRVYEKPDPDSTVLGWLRSGSRVRLAEGPEKRPNCATGFYRLRPRGYACAGEGIEVADAPPESHLALTPPPKDAGLPYSYYFVKEPMVPEYHQLPSRKIQRAAETYIARYLELKADEKQQKRFEKFKAGELQGEPTSPSGVRRYLERGFFVAGAAVEERLSRMFVRTVRGAYVKLAQLEPREGPSFHGVDLEAVEEHSLPLAWAVRTAQPFNIKQRADGSQALIADAESEPFERLSLVPWEKFERVGNQIYHRLKDGRYLKYWFLAVAEQRKRPEGVAADEPWVHVNLEQQTLVAYRGDKPVYATLVSSGLPEHDTPVGLFEIRTKQTAATMSDIGPDVGDDQRYSIEDVPYTQYFDGSIALHGAFWHERFGLQRSHGCVNLAPKDARAIFAITWPDVPDGWHGATTEDTGFRTSKVLVTEK